MEFFHSGDWPCAGPFLFAVAENFCDGLGQTSGLQCALRLVGVNLRAVKLEFAS
jgi:hypothetical protein